MKIAFVDVLLLFREVRYCNARAKNNVVTHVMGPGKHMFQNDASIEQTVCELELSEWMQ